MTFAIDFDGTFSADPPLFRDIVGLMKSHGHKVVMVTGRSNDQGGEIDVLVGDLMPVIFAGREWKKMAAFNAGYDVDVWIDDNPEWVTKQL